MSSSQQIRIWLIGAAVFLGFIWLFSSVLLPFVAAAAVAYFLDPAADKLEDLGLSRTLATVVITVGFVLLLVGALVVIVPLLEGQVRAFATRVPGYIETLGSMLQPYVETLASNLGEEQMAKIKDALGAQAGSVASWVGGALRRLMSGGAALVSLISLLVITPVVTFYLLRDWDVMVAKIDGWLPRDQLETIREVARRIDRTLAGFARGQITVCLILAALYATGLTVIGLDIGLLVGLAAGLISFIPYVGSISGFVVAVGLGIAQFQDFGHPLAIGGVFLVGQLLEGYYLTPKLVGENVGLHAVWIIFALMGGGAVLGFVGMLIAVPVAAVIGVLARFALERYMDSPMYTGTGMGTGASSSVPTENE